MDDGTSKRMELITKFLVLFSVLLGLYFTTRVNYLLFHALAEGFSIVVASSIFIITWNSKKYNRNPYLLFVGIACLFIALLDMLHTLSYTGMPIFTDYDYYANQLWIGARYMESATLLLAFTFIRRGKVPRANIVFVIYTVITCLIIASIFYWKIFPECFVEGKGLTPFKKNSEYFICLILLASMLLLVKNREKFERKVFLLILLSIVSTIISELSFTFYISNYGLSNVVGHYFKIFSFLLMYEAIVKTGMEKPLELIFHDLDQANKRLSQEIEIRISVQHEKELLIDQLKQTLDEINTLKGILPLCSFCKKIRDEHGHWQQVDVYIHEHSQADISHSICPECMHKHYPEG